MAKLGTVEFEAQLIPKVTSGLLPVTIGTVTMNLDEYTAIGHACDDLAKRLRDALETLNDH